MDVLAIDPGTTHLVAVLFHKEEDTITKVWSHMFNVQHDFVEIANAAKCMSQVAAHFQTQDAIIEFQAPMGQPHACRWNAFVEGGISACLATHGMDVEVVHPSTVKRKLGLATGNYANNKRIAFMHAKERCDGISSHHEADCFILAEWWFNK
jgi:hypothetical protein